MGKIICKDCMKESVVSQGAPQVCEFCGSSNTQDAWEWNKAKNAMHLNEKSSNLAPQPTDLGQEWDKFNKSLTPEAYDQKVEEERMVKTEQIRHEAETAYSAFVEANKPKRYRDNLIAIIAFFVLGPMFPVMSALGIYLALIILFGVPIGIKLFLGHQNLKLERAVIAENKNKAVEIDALRDEKLARLETECVKKKQDYREQYRTTREDLVQESTQKIIEDVSAKFVVSPITDEIVDCLVDEIVRGVNGFVRNTTEREVRVGRKLMVSENSVKWADTRDFKSWSKEEGKYYSFAAHSVKDLPDVDDQIGLLKAVASKMQIRVMELFPVDPCGTDRTVELSEVKLTDIYRTRKADSSQPGMSYWELNQNGWMAADLVVGECWIYYCANNSNYVEMREW